MIKRRVIWTSEDEDFLRKNYSEIGVAECAIQLGRTTSATQARCHFLGLRKRSVAAPYTDEEDDFITTFHLEMTPDELSATLNRSTSSIRQRLKHIGKRSLE